MWKWGHLNKKKGVCLAFHHPVHIPLSGMHPLARLGGGKALHLLRMVLLRGKAEAEAF